MEGVARAVFVIGAVLAGTALSEVASVNLKAVIPHILKSVASDVAFHKLGATLDIEAGSDVTVVHDACSVYARVAEEVPLADFALVFNGKEVRATVGDFHSGLESVGLNKVENILVFVHRKHKLGVILGTADGLDVDNAPGADAEGFHDFIHFVKLTDVSVMHDSGNLDVVKALFVKEIPDAGHGAFIASGHLSEPIVGVLKTVYTD